MPKVFFCFFFLFCLYSGEDLMAQTDSICLDIERRSPLVEEEFCSTVGRMGILDWSQLQKSNQVNFYRFEPILSHQELKETLASYCIFNDLLPNEYIPRCWSESGGHAFVYRAIFSVSNEESPAKKFFSYTTHDDNCDGGNLYGVILSFDRKTPIAHIHDETFYCD